MSLRWFILFLGLGLCGCGSRSDLVRITGKITIDGTPLETGIIRFIPATGRAALGHIKDGEFRLRTYHNNDGCLIGSHRIEVIAYKDLAPGERLWLTPAEYRDVSTSNLSEQITPETREVQIELSWNGGQPYVETPNGIRKPDQTSPTALDPAQIERDPLLQRRE